jgi:hypothetical protein
MRYVLLFIIYLIGVTIIWKRLHKENTSYYLDIFLLVLMVHLVFAFFGLIIFIFYYFW